jgi:hypothetical protein
MPGTRPSTVGTRSAGPETVRSPAAHRALRCPRSPTQLRTGTRYCVWRGPPSTSNIASTEFRVGGRVRTCSLGSMASVKSAVPSASTGVASFRQRCRTTQATQVSNRQDRAFSPPEPSCSFKSRPAPALTRFVGVAVRAVDAYALRPPRPPGTSTPSQGQLIVKLFLLSGEEPDD